MILAQPRSPCRNNGTMCIVIVPPAHVVVVCHIMRDYCIAILV